MADVIFNGTDGRQTTRMAEVSLTIGDVDPSNCARRGSSSTYNEVTLTRRVFRDGGSEYFINKTAVPVEGHPAVVRRHGHGQDELLDHGPGQHHADPQQQARGSPRWCSRKPPASPEVQDPEEAKPCASWKQTEQNLLRVADLIREVKRQIGSLQRQAGKARRFQADHGELQHLDTQLARHQFDVLTHEIRERETGSEQLRTEIETVLGRCAARRGRDPAIAPATHRTRARDQRRATARNRTQGPGRSRRQPHPIPRGTPPRNWISKTPAAWRKSPKPRNAPSPPNRNSPRSPSASARRRGPRCRTAG
jgi:hypothetical protein